MFYLVLIMQTHNWSDNLNKILYFSSRTKMLVRPAENFPFDYFLNYWVSVSVADSIVNLRMKKRSGTRRLNYTSQIYFLAVTKFYRIVAKRDELTRRWVFSRTLKKEKNQQHALIKSVFHYANLFARTEKKVT